MRWIFGLLLTAGCVAAAALVVVLSRDGGSDDAPTVPRDVPTVASTMPGAPMPGRVLVGFQDDVSLRWAEDRAEMLDEAREAGAAVVRTIVEWRAVARKRPFEPANPFDPAYRLDDVDDLARSAQARGMELLLSIWGTPPWANGGAGPNRAPLELGDLEDFAHALAARYSGRHAGYPAVRLFSAWNEPNLEQFLAPQFDRSGQSVSPGIYAGLARAVYAGVKQANAEALVAIGETSPRGHDRPGGADFQDSHSPARFARLLADEADVRFDAWAHHPYPARAEVAPSAPVRWPRVGMANLERFGESLDEWFHLNGVPLWVTEYGHETEPDVVGVPPDVQARFLEEALALAAASDRVRVFVWFILRDAEGEPWESGLIATDGSAKPALERFASTVPKLDGRNPVVSADTASLRLPVLELAFHNPAGARIDVEIDGGRPVVATLRSDGWIDVSVPVGAPDAFEVRARDVHGNEVVRLVERDPRDGASSDILGAPGGTGAG